MLIDAWVNPNPASGGVDPTVAGMFRGLVERKARGTTLAQLLEEMDASGVEKAVLCAAYAGRDNLGWVIDAASRYPERFAVSLCVDPRRGMHAVRQIDDGFRNCRVKLVRVLALDTQLPYDHAAYFPVYAKCAELGIPVGVNVGLPGPAVPGKHQHPLALDDVCAFFPELRIIMSHGGEPWTDLCVKLMSKWPNLSYMSSAFAPRRIPREVIEFANRRGSDQVMWATDYPVLDFERCRREILELPFVDEERRRKFAAENARRLFFS